MKKYKSHFALFSFLIISLCLLNQCENDIKSDDMDIVRPMFRLITTDIPTFNGMTQTKLGETPRSVEEILPGIHTEIYEFRWDSDSGDYSYIMVWVAESKKKAFDILKEKQKLYTIPRNLLEEAKDEPAIVGDLSYFNGLEFIRDNFIVRIHISEKYKNSVNEIANYVDAKILKCT